MRIVVGCDDAGLDYKERIAEDLRADPRVSEVIDLGVHRDAEDVHRPYPEIGLAAGEAVRDGKADRAVLICGTGIGMALSANKVSGVWATTAHDSFSVERSILSNNCQVLTLGQRVVGLELARRLVGEWLGYTFDDQSASAAKVGLISEYERC
ncbi:ribose-5-phosphate isomerase [Amycolatopsis sp. K13G38]|uniref:Ribose-5-phosphate isomerase n=1 Tax=Amycolatopsis acididurans TaxID=2724524 RepID=A0ABX1J5P1_9PSEU|nr:ribose-5-phosphate isomerase [Amycolatopsis acididurans]NKQ54671.1 ribose-5-phosphate isomerase [Amycolatopsis acididurans]